MAHQGARPDPSVTRQRELEAWELVAQGFSQREIAKRIGISQPAVCVMLDRIQQRVLATLEKKVKLEKSRQSAILDYVLAEAAAAWRESKDAFKVSTKKTRKKPRRLSASGAVIRNPDDDEADDGLQLEELMNRAESRYGDARFLAEIRGALADKRKLWGLDVAPAPQGPGGNPLDKLSLDDLEAFERRLEKQLTDARATPRGSK